MATCEDEPQSIVLQILVLRCRPFLCAFMELFGDLELGGVEARAPANGVDGLESTGRYEPRTRILGHAVSGPLFDRRPECIVQGLLCQIEVAEHPYESREHPPRLV